MSIKVFNKTRLVEMPMDDSYVPLVVDDSAFDDAGLYIVGYRGQYAPTYQAASAMDASVWVSTFKQRPMTSVFSGVLVADVCDGSNLTQRKKAFVELYKKYKITVAETPLKVAFHDIILTGFFDQLAISNDKSIPKALAFEMSFYGLPTTLMDATELAPSQPTGVATPSFAGGTTEDNLVEALSDVLTWSLYGSDRQ